MFQEFPRFFPAIKTKGQKSGREGRRRRRRSGRHKNTGFSSPLSNGSEIDRGREKMFGTGNMTLRHLKKLVGGWEVKEEEEEVEKAKMIATYLEFFSMSRIFRKGVSDLPRKKVMKNVHFVLAAFSRAWEGRTGKLLLLFPRVKRKDKKWWFASPPLKNGFPPLVPIVQSIWGGVLSALI